MQKRFSAIVALQLLEQYGDVEDELVSETLISETKTFISETETNVV